MSRTRRELLRDALAFGALSTLPRFVTGGSVAHAGEGPRVLSGDVIDLEIAETEVVIDGRRTLATTVNGGIPGPEIRLREGQDVVLRVTNRLKHTSSIHWHGILLPSEMDGVPGVSFDGIAPGTTFEYRFTVRQSGTYWYHSHSGFQEQTGVFGPLVIESADPPVHPVDREITVVLSDWTFAKPERILARLKKYGGYYNFQRRTLANLPAEARAMGLGAALGDRARWGRMRMDSTDLADVTGATYTYLVNGVAPDDNGTHSFLPGERIRLRLTNTSAATAFDFRIPGLAVTIIEADGQPVEPLRVEELRVAIAESYDLLIEPTEEAYTLFAEAADRSGFARATLSSRVGAVALVPERRPRPLLTMADMGMDHSTMKGMEGMDHAAMGHTMPEPVDHAAMGHTMPEPEPVDHAAMGHTMPKVACEEVLPTLTHAKGGHGPGNTSVAQIAKNRADEPGTGLGDDGWSVLRYGDLRRARPGPLPREPDREIELHLTGNMERYMWSFDGEPYRHDTPDIQLAKGERVRFVLINDTMMTHPIHLHGMWFEVEVGACGANPLKHTVNVAPAERLSFVVDAEEVGRWAFHCHILYHMEAGMFRVVQVTA